MTKYGKENPMTTRVYIGLEPRNNPKIPCTQWNARLKHYERELPRFEGHINDLKEFENTTERTLMKLSPVDQAAILEGLAQKDYVGMVKDIIAMMSDFLFLARVSGDDYITVTADKAAIMIIADKHNAADVIYNEAHALVKEILQRRIDLRKDK